MDIQTLLQTFLAFIKTSLPRFILLLAILFFMVNAVRFFFIGAGDEKSREKAKRLALYGLLAFVIIIALWGIVNIFRDALGVGGSTQTPVKIDYTQP